MQNDDKNQNTDTEETSMENADQNQPTQDAPVDQETASEEPKVEEAPAAVEPAPVEKPAPVETPAAEEETTQEETKQGDQTPVEEEKVEQAAESPAKDVEESEEKEKTPAPAPKRDVPGARWYVVHTYSGHEAKVAATLKQRVESQKLQDKVLDILVPTQDKIEIKEGKKNKIKEKIFPGYLLIRMLLDDNTWLVVRTTPGITSFVGMGNRPTPLPDAEVASIQRFMTMEAPKFKASFSVSEAVKITDGPFSEFLGTISEIDDEKGKIKVLVSIFGRETPVELDFLQVAKL